MITEIHRPRSLESYVGHNEQVQIVVNWLNGWVDRKPFARVLIVHGPPGTGKTTLAKCLANDYKMPLIHNNMSLDRDLHSLREIRRSSMSGQVGRATGLKLLVLDECDSLTTTGWKQVQELLKETQSPVILIANYAYEIPKEVKQGAVEIMLGKPTQAELKVVLDRALKADPDTADLSAGELMELTKRSPSYRALLHGLYTRSSPPESLGDLRDPKTLATQIFAGKVGVGDVKGYEVERVFPWVYDNTRDWDAVEVVDWLNAARRRVGMGMHKYVVAFAKLCRPDGEIRFPWSLASNTPWSRKQNSPARAPRAEQGRARAQAPAGAATPTPPPLIAVDQFF